MLHEVGLLSCTHTEPMNNPPQPTLASEAGVAEQRLRFLRAMNHDLRNPIATQLNLIESLLDGIPGPITDRQQTYLQRLEERSRLLLGLLNDVMELAGRSSLPMTDEAVVLEFSSIASSLSRLMSSVAIRTGKVVKMDFTEAEVVRCLSASDLKLLVMSLGSDVVRHAGKGGELRLQLHRMDERVSLDIRDDRYDPSSPDATDPGHSLEASPEDLPVAAELARRLGVTWAPLVVDGKPVGYRVELG